jgi:uncharacterized repeat protein (TIGR01451 family)
VGSHGLADRTPRVRGSLHAVTPAATVLVIATILQVLVALLAPSLPPTGKQVTASADSSLDYAPQPGVAIPGLQQEFLRAALGRHSEPMAPQVIAVDNHEVAFAPVRANSRPPPTSTTTTTTTQRTLIGGAAKLRFAMTASPTTVATGEDLLYEVTVHNDGGSTFTGSVTIRTHAPRGTFSCSISSSESPCVIPGDYDGSSQSSNDLHENPPERVRAFSTGPNDQDVVLTLRVRVAPATASGTVLMNHAHLYVPGSSSVITVIAPDVRVA